MPNSRNGSRLRDPREEQRVQLGEGRQHVLLLPGGTAAQRGLVEPGHVCGGDQRFDQLHHVRDRLRRLCQAGVDEPGRDLRAGHVRDHPRAPLNGHVLEDDQVYSQSAQVRPDRHRRVWHALRPRRGMHLPAAAADLVQVMLDTPRGQRRHLKLLQGSRHTQVCRRGKIRPAGIAAPGRTVMSNLIGLGPAQSPHPANQAASRACGRCRPCAVPAGVAPARASHPTRAALRNCGCCGPAAAAVRQSRPAAPRPPGRARRSPDPGRRMPRTRQRAAAARSQATMIRTTRP